MRLGLALFALLLGIRDRTSMMPLTGRMSTKTVPDHILGAAKLPGGTLGEYGRYQLFIVETESNQKAAILLFDLKGSMKDPAFVAHMGGYSGTLNGKPIYAFAKLQYLAGVVGLPNDKADPIARDLASRLH